MNQKKNSLKVFAYIGVVFLLVGLSLVSVGFYGVIMNEFTVGSVYFTLLITGAPFFIIGIVYSIIGFIAMIDKTGVSTLRCPYCGAKNKSNARRCFSCNQKLDLNKR